MGKKRKLSPSENEEVSEQEDQQNDDESEHEEEEEEDEPTSSADQPESNNKVVNISKDKKKPTPGVIYLSRIPDKMNVAIIRSYFDEYAPTGRIYLQLGSK